MNQQIVLNINTPYITHSFNLIKHYVSTINAYFLHLIDVNSSDLNSPLLFVNKVTCTVILHSFAWATYIYTY